MKKAGQNTKLDEKYHQWTGKAPYYPRPEHKQKKLFPENNFNEWEYLPLLDKPAEAVHSESVNELQTKFPFDSDSPSAKTDPRTLKLEYPKLEEDNISTSKMRPEDERRIHDELKYYVERGKINPTYYSHSRVNDDAEVKKLKQYLADNEITNMVKARILAKYEELRQKSIEFYAKYQEANNLAQSNFEIDTTVDYEEFFRQFSQLLVVEISKQIGELFGVHADEKLITNLKQGLNIFNIHSLNYERKIEQMDSMIRSIDAVIIDYEHRKKLLKQLKDKVDSEVEAFLSNPHWVTFLRWMDEYFPSHKEQFAKQAIDAAKKSSAMSNAPLSFSSLIRFKTYKSIYEKAESAATIDLKRQMERTVSSEITDALTSQIRKKVKAKARLLQRFFEDVDLDNPEEAAAKLIIFCKRAFNIDLKPLFNFAYSSVKKRSEWYYEATEGAGSAIIEANKTMVERNNRLFLHSFVKNIPSILEIYISSTGHYMRDEVGTFVTSQLGKQYNQFVGIEDLEKVLKLNSKEIDQLANNFFQDKLVGCIPGFQNKYETADGGKLPNFGGIRGVIDDTNGKFSIESFTNFSHSKTPFIPKDIWLSVIKTFFREVDHAGLNSISSLEGTNCQNTLQFIVNILRRERKFEHNSFLKFFRTIDKYTLQFSKFRSGLPKGCTDEDTVELMTLAVRSVNTIDRDLENFDQFVKLIHDEAGQLSDQVLKNMVRNKNFFNFNKVGIVKKVFRAYAQIRNRLGVKNIFKQYGPIITDLKKRKFIGADFKENLLVIERFFESNAEISPASPEFSKLFEAASKVESDLNVIEMGDALKDLLTDYKPKQKQLFNLNLQLRDDIRFRVLGNKDPRILRIGIETDCCQRIGGAGEVAARDSFINPLSSVLVLEWKDPQSQDWKLLAQSYFHYVPADNGYILDNVEYNRANTNEFKEQTDLSLEEVYALYASKIKEKVDVKYLLAGKSFSKIEPNKFKTDKRYKDPRSFDNRALTDKNTDHYSDYEERGSIDLLGPKFNLFTVDRKISKASTEIRKLIKALITPSTLIKFAQQENLKQDVRRLQGVNTVLFGPKSWDFINQLVNEINNALVQLSGEQKIANRTVNFQTVVTNPTASTRFTGGFKNLFNLSLALWITITANRDTVYSIIEAKQFANSLLTQINSADFPEPQAMAVKAKLLAILNNWLAILQ